MTVHLSARRGSVAAMALGACLLLSPFAVAQEEPVVLLTGVGGGAVPGAERVAAGPSDAAELEAFFDGLMKVQARHLDNVGATVAVVKGGEILFAKGYGFADLEAGVAVDPEATLFRIGSVSKLFVWISVMQLVEEGRLDLHADINEYLEAVEIPATWDEPVTMAHLMTHTPGFEDRVVGLFARKEEQLVPLEEILTRQNPARVRPPGDQPSYSNHGTAMAALVVEAISGQPWTELVQQRILDPLGMASTTFAQPLPDNLASRMSKGYAHAGDHFEEKEFELVPLYPIGAASATATDMARLMIALLQNGRYGESRILAQETAEVMRSALVEVDPAVNPSPHGFMDMSTRGIHIVGHGGDTFWFHTLLALFPEHDLGLFVSYNTDKGGGGGGPLLATFLDQYFSPAARPLGAPEDFADRAARYEGEFRGNRFAHTTLAKLGAVAGAFEVAVNEDGELQVFDSRFVETAPRVFTELDGERTLVFIEGEDGPMSHFYNAQYPIVTFERVPASEGRSLHLILLVLASVAFLGTILAWPTGWAVRRWFSVGEAPDGRIPRPARLALWATASLLLGSTVGLLIILTDPTDIAFGDVSTTKKLLVLPLIALLPALAALLATWRMWRRGLGTRTGRGLYTLTVLLVLAFYWQLTVWNVLGFKL
jgi:CubicO group peptidase (beta-lactamase class C family)